MRCDSLVSTFRGLFDAWILIFHAFVAVPRPMSAEEIAGRREQARQKHAQKMEKATLPEGATAGAEEDNRGNTHIIPLAAQISSIF